MTMNLMHDIPIDCSIVIPVYYNEGALTSTLASLKQEVVAANPSRRFEVIFVDDGSGDGSLDELMRLRDANPDLVTVIKLTRNFGQVSALTAGHVHARGRCVVAMSADGQDPVRLINDMLSAHFDEGYEVAVCTRVGRDESLYRILTSRIFYNMMRKMTVPDMPAGGFDFMLISRRVLPILLRNLDANNFWQGQLLWLGFPTKFIEYQRRSRAVGRSRWTFGKKLTYMIDGMMSFSFLPIRIISGAGIIVALLGFLYALWIVIAYFAWGLPVKGWAPIMIIMLLMGGFQMLMLGVVGEYLWRTLSQVRNRDRYVIDAIYDNESMDEVGGQRRSERVHAGHMG
jgi:dolichol-phosphate mannosyltransferase